MDYIGKKVIITNKESFYYGEWGIIKYYDGFMFAIAIANDKNSFPVFYRDEFRIPRNQEKQS